MKRKCHQMGLTLSSKAKSGFSMVELLVVIGVMSLLVTVTMVNMQGFNKSGNLTSAGNLLVDMANQARQLATTKNAPTALVIITTSSLDIGKTAADTKVAYKTFCIMQYLPPTPTSTNSQWVMATRWQSLPASVAIDNSTVDTTSFLSTGTVTTTTTLSPTHLGKTYTSNPAGANVIAFQLFNPEGGMDTSGNVKRLRLISEKKNPNETSPNFYDIVFNPYTGSTKVFRTGEEVRN